MEDGACWGGAGAVWVFYGDLHQPFLVVQGDQILQFMKTIVAGALFEHATFIARLGSPWRSKNLAWFNFTKNMASGRLGSTVQIPVDYGVNFCPSMTAEISCPSMTNKPPTNDPRTMSDRLSGVCSFVWAVRRPAPGAVRGESALTTARPVHGTVRGGSILGITRPALGAVRGGSALTTARPVHGTARGRAILGIARYSLGETY